MPFQTNLNTPPYHDDYDETKDFGKILFKPDVSVQARELNQLQSILQKQIERFGDHIFKSGTIVSGCNFIYHPAYSYIKIQDTEEDGIIAVVSNYDGQFAINESTGLSCAIQAVYDGFEATDPDLKTLYVKYTNSGTDGNTASYAPNDVIKIYDLTRSIWKVNIENGGSGFSNTDTVVVSPRLIVNVASGSFANGDYVTNNLGANLHIVGVDTVTYAAKSQIVLTVEPTPAILASASSNTTNWTIQSGQTITNAGNTVSATCEGLIGVSSRMRIVTDGVGKVSSVAVLARGQKYDLPPRVTVLSPNNSVGIAALDLVAQNYIGKVTVSDVAGSVGNGYAFSVSDGVIYQRGAFLRSEPQTIIVSKYDTVPSNVAVGFATREEIVDSNKDTSLLDNATGTENATAPGADRLKLTPALTLTTISDAESNGEFFILSAWSEGMPYLQNQVSQYDALGDEIALRTKEESGNYVVDSFLMSTRSPVQANLEGGYYSAVIDPGTAYINGYRVATTTNFALDVIKPTTTLVSNTQHVNMNYGSYVFVQQLGGTFQFNTGDTVDLYDAAKTFITSSIANYTSITAAGTKIGTARIRSLIYHSGTPGTTTAVYRLYLFNITMNSGKSFADAKSVYYNGTRKGICDLVLELNGTNNANNAVLKEANNSQLLFTTGVDSMVNSNGAIYMYRTIDQSRTVANTGLITKDISANPDELFPYSGSLTTSQLTDIVVMPVASDLIFTTNVVGTGSANTTSANVVGASSTWATDLRAGDYVYLTANGTASQLKRVTGIVNNTFMTMDSNCSFANTTCGVYRAFPANLPIPLGVRSGISANVNSGQTVLTINLGTTFQYSGTQTISLAYNTQRQSAAHSTKTANRSKFVKINLANSAAGVVGPWCLGVPDAFRLRGVYVGNSSVSNTDTNSITSFYIDNNQNPDFLDLSYLYPATKAPITLTTANYLLVEFDYFTGSGVGYYEPTSYVGSNTAARIINDGKTLAQLTTEVNSFEVPELFNNEGQEYDLLQYFDFRPAAASTVTPGATVGAAPINPSNTVSFGNTANSSNELKFPYPGAEFIFNVEQFLGRTDSIFIHQDQRITVVQGVPDVSPAKRFAPATPQDSIKLTDLVVPAFPNLPIVRSTELSDILNTRVINGKYLKMREDGRAISKPRTQTGAAYSVPKVYTMADIGHIDRRLQDVEYYVSLNLLESNTVNMAIPSSVDPSLNRFKYGFFADDLSTYAFSDRDNPAYQAYIEDNAAVPEKLNWDMYLNGAIGGPDYADFPLVVQDNASWPDTLGPVCVLQYVTYNVVPVTPTIVRIDTPVYDNPGYILTYPRDVEGYGGGGVGGAY